MIKLKRWFRKLNYKYSNFKSQDENAIKLYWWNGKTNLGDVVNKFIAEQLSNKTVEWVPSNYSEPYHLAIGSVIQKCNDNSIVWGSGIISDNNKIPLEPKEVLAVRGPLTREHFINSGIACPEVYGDPALILPRLLSPESKEIKYEIGIIPHYVDKDHKFFNQSFPENITLIDIETDDIQLFINQINSCEMILSSSLHGVIIADAYGVPAHHIQFSDNVKGNNFKFRDYYMSVSRDEHKPIYIQSDTEVESLYELNKDIKLDIQVEKLIEVCPFIDKEVKKRLLDNNK